MARYSSPQEVRKEHLDTLGPQLGPVYHALCNECAWLHLKWNQYLELYGAKPERIDLLNRVASLFFHVVQHALWEDTLLHLARLTERSTSMRKDNLTVQRLPALIVDAAFRREIEGLVNVAVKATAFARDWRNRRIAHRDLALALTDRTIEALAPASRQDVKDALDSVSHVLQRANEFFFRSELRFDLTAEPNDAVSLLYVIRDGVEAKERRQQRLHEGKTEPEDMQPPREV